MPREALTVRIDPDTKKALDALAVALDRGRSYVVNEALSAYLEMHRWQLEHIRQGVREADAGKFVSEPEIRKVLARLRRK